GIIQATSAYPAINSGGSAQSTDWFTFTAPASDTLRAIPLKLTINSNGGNETEAFILNVKSADLMLSDRRVTKNGGNVAVNTFSVGDEVHLVFTVRNQGQVEARTVVGELTPVNPNLATVTQHNNQSFG